MSWIPNSRWVADELIAIGYLMCVGFWWLWKLISEARDQITQHLKNIAHHSSETTLCLQRISDELSSIGEELRKRKAEPSEPPTGD